MPSRARKRSHLGETIDGERRRRAEMINQVWSLVFIFDETAWGSHLRWLPCLDE